MRIVDGKVNVCSPGRNFVTLKLVTEDGVYGVGDATLNGRELAVASYLSDHVLPLLIGRDARRIEDIWQYLYKGAYWRRGPVTMTAIAAVDTALWDIRGKTLGVPVYQLLGGASRESVMVYGHANGNTVDEVVQVFGRPSSRAPDGTGATVLTYDEIQAIGDTPTQPGTHVSTNDPADKGYDGTPSTAAPADRTVKTKTQAQFWVDGEGKVTRFWFSPEMYKKGVPSPPPPPPAS